MSTTRPTTALRSGRRHVSEERAHLHYIHEHALTQQKARVDCGLPYSLQTRGGGRALVDGRRVAMEAAARAAVIDAENGRMGAKLRSIYLRDARAMRVSTAGASPQLAVSAQREAHMEDPELDRLRRHTQACFDLKRQQQAEATFAANQQLAARLAAAPPLVGSLEAQKHYQQVLARRAALRSKFKVNESANYEAALALRREKTKRLLARRAERLEREEDARDDAAADVHGAFLAYQRAQQRLLLQQQTRALSASPSRRPQSAAALRQLTAGGNEEEKEGAHGFTIKAFKEKQEQQEQRDSADGEEYPSNPQDSDEHAELQSSPQPAQKQRPGSAVRSSAGKSSVSPPGRRSRSAARRRGDGQPLRPPSRSPGPEWSTRDYMLAAAGMHYKGPPAAGSAASPSAVAGSRITSSAYAEGRGHERSNSSGLSASKSHAVLLAARPSTAAAGRASPTAAVEMYFGAREAGRLTPRGQERLSRGGAQAEELLAGKRYEQAQQQRDARAAAAEEAAVAQSSTHSRQTYSPVRSSSPSRGSPTRNIAAKKVRPASAAPGLASRSAAAGSRSLTSLQAFFDSATGGAGVGTKRSTWTATMAPLADPSVEEELESILREHHLDVRSMQPLGRIAVVDPPPRAETDAFISEAAAAHAARRQEHHAKNRAMRSSVALSDDDLALQVARAREQVVQAALQAAQEENEDALSPYERSQEPQPSSTPLSGEIPTISAALGQTTESFPVHVAAAQSPQTSNPTTPSRVFPASPEPMHTAPARASHVLPRWADPALQPATELAPPARPWRSPPGMPKISFKAALEQEAAAAAADDGGVPHAAPAAEGDNAADEAAAEAAWRGKLDWEEAQAEVETPKLSPEQQMAYVAHNGTAHAAGGRSLHHSASGTLAVGRPASAVKAARTLSRPASAKHLAYTSTGHTRPSASLQGSAKKGARPEWAS